MSQAPEASSPQVVFEGRVFAGLCEAARHYGVGISVIAEALDRRVPVQAVIAAARAARR